MFNSMILSQCYYKTSFQAQQQNYELLNDDDIEGQEDETIERDGEIKITPFNLKEEQVKLLRLISKKNR